MDAEIPHQVWSGDSGGVISVWDAERIRFVKEIDTGVQKRIRALVAVKGRYVWCGFDSKILIYDAKVRL